tara:strand:- start:5157 stop:5879 length:723 start_codon:yes stop_codon:yes gene_type:complete
MNMTNVRINKYLSEIGYCSRREADNLIKQGRVKANNNLVSLGTKVSIDSEIRVDNKVIKKEEKLIYLAFNKPIGIVCTTDVRVEKNNIIDYINYPLRIYPIGRLDKNSEGLIFLTNDGNIVNKILRSKNKNEKEYIVEVSRTITKSFIDQMRKGIPILGTVTDPCVVKQIHKKKFRIILTQGLNRQIRRMCEYLNYRVTSLRRVRIMNIRLDLVVGKYRHLSKKELKGIFKLLEGSSNEF